MKTGIILFFIIGLNIVFTVWHEEHPAKYDIFLFSDKPLSAENICYFIFEHFSLLAITLMWYSDSSEEKKPYIFMFIVLQVLDFMDFIFSHNKIYFTVKQYPFSFNTFMTVAYITFLFHKKYGSNDSLTNQHHTANN